MGMISRIIGGAPAVTALGHAATGMAEIFTQNATRRMELNEDAHARAIAQHGQEFMAPREGWFDRFVNGLNRLPRPMLALGTMCLFIYAMVEPQGFGLRMQHLQLVPEPLWWLLGAIVGFYFGAREAHYLRNRNWPAAKPGPDQAETA
ncbi:MAG: holin family protein, partial [Paracoccus sp. (in: a-proteobacteria)]|nr:holin family protein [Paracoccus sp. (in: a-proteobacteria)]